MIQTIIKIKDSVQQLLVKYEHLRDDDHRLIANIYYKVAKEKNPTQTYSAMDFLHDFAKGYYPSPETIRRCRQKIQEDHPQLRGSSYKERHSKAKEFKTQIKNV